MAADLLQYLPSLLSIVDRQILTVEPSTPLVSAIELMRVDRSLPRSAALVTSGDRLVGILTESDIVRLASNQRSWRGLTVGEVMVGEPHLLKLAATASAIDVLEIFCRHQIRHLPILDTDDRLVGMVTPQSICRSLAANSPPTVSIWDGEQKFRAIFDRTFQFIGLLDPAGILLEANRTALTAINANPADVIGIPFWQTPWWAHSPQLQQQLQQAIDRGAAGEFVRFEAKHYLADGSYVIVDFSLSPICDDRGKVVMLIPEGRDITARKETELALQASESRFRALLTAAPVGIFQADIEGNCVFVNERGIQLMGIPLDRILGRGWLDAIHPDDRSLINRQWSAAVAAEGEFSLEHRFLTPQGRVNWVSSQAVPVRDLDGNITGYLGTTIDITERKTNERKIAEQAALLNIVTDAIIVCDLDGRVEFWNHAATQIYGWSATEAIGQMDDRLFYPHSPQAVAASAARSHTIAEGTWQGELHRTAKDGHQVIVASRWNLVRDESGTARSILSVDTDITEKKQLEQQFLRAQRLESLGTLASGIAHDLNNMLTPILGVAQLLPHTLPNLDDRHRRLLDMLLESARRGSGLVKQILTFARGMDGERTAIQVRHILTEIVSVARQTFPKSIEISLNLPVGDSWLVNADATQIHQVLMNLFVNARDALPGGGKITASVENMTIKNGRTQRYLQLPVGAYLKIAVSDTGIGMNETTIDRIFDPFYTTKATGTGLGLSTVSGIIRAHGGTIDVDSKLGAGSCFNIYLPASERAETPTPITRHHRYDGNGRSILVVDDETGVREILKATLERHNYRVILASDGIEAIALYAEHHGQITTIIIDMMMPYLDTHSTIAALEQIDNRVPIIAISGSVANLETISTHSSIRAAIAKPFSIDELLQIIARENRSLL
jgi:PAS domain S-box-containing protein